MLASVVYFGSTSHRGREAAEIPGGRSWHTLCHTFSTLMKANGEDMKTIQELVRHANYKVTADTYGQAVTPASEQRKRSC